MINELNEKYGIKGLINFSLGEGSLPKAEINYPSGQKAEVYLYGAHVTSYSMPQFGEILFLSKAAEFKPGKAIRGGIPVIFPQFGNGPLPAHGFARNAMWQVKETEAKDNVSLTLTLVKSPETEAIWPHSFQYDLEIALTLSGLSQSVKVTNIGDVAFAFQQALHSYFKISDIQKVHVEGLRNLKYLDKLLDFKELIEESSQLKFSSAFDRIYKNSPETVSLIDPGLKRKIQIVKHNMADSVLWNPWEGSSSMKDMHKDSHLEMICIESGSVADAVQLKPGAVFEARQDIFVSAL